MRADADEDRAGGQEGDEHGGLQEEEDAGCCSCLPFRRPWGSIRRPVAAGERRGRRRRFRIRIRLRLSWFSWPWWLRNSGAGKKKKTTTTEAKGRKGMKKRMLLLLASLLTSPPPPSQAKKALAMSASAAGSLLLPKVSSFADGKKKRNGSSLTAAASTDKATAAPARPETTTTVVRQPSSCCPRPADEPRAGASAVRRTPSRRHGTPRPDGGGCAGGSLWTMATTLGVIVFFGRVTAVAFLCSCLYGALFVRAQAAGAAKGKTGDGAGGSSSSSSGRFGELVVAEERVAVVDLCTEEHKKKVVMEGLLDRAGKRLSSQFL